MTSTTAPDAPPPEFAAGQVWSYRTRPGEEDSALLINRVEPHEKLGPIFHISLSGLRVPDAQAPDGLMRELPHCPVSLKTLRESCTVCRGQADANPEHEEGLATWRAAFDAGRAGIFTITVADIVGVVEKTLGGSDTA